MHALLVTVKLDGITDPEGAQKDLTENVVPMVSKSPGFIHGYWLEPAGTNGYSTVLYDTEENAKNAEQMAKQFFASDQVFPGVKLAFTQVMAVVAHA